MMLDANSTSDSGFKLSTKVHTKKPLLNVDNTDSDTSDSDDKPIKKTKKSLETLQASDDSE